jgi:hypothetical protein
MEAKGTELIPHNELTVTVVWHELQLRRGVLLHLWPTLAKLHMLEREKPHNITGTTPTKSGSRVARGQVICRMSSLCFEKIGLLPGLCLP